MAKELHVTLVIKRDGEECKVQTRIYSEDLESVKDMYADKNKANIERGVDDFYDVVEVF